jgi:serine/threonine protein kinase
MSTTMGTPAFMAPEMCGPKATLFAPSPAEVWSVGVCLYMLAFGRGETRTPPAWQTQPGRQCCQVGKHSLQSYCTVVTASFVPHSTTLAQ